MELENLNQSQFIELCKLRLKNKNKDYTEITIEDATFRYFNGVSFIVKSDKWADDRFSFSFDMFYPNEFMYLLGLGVEFEIQKLKDMQKDNLKDKAFSPFADIKSICVCQNRQDQFKRGDTWICGDCEEEIKQTVL
jgi:hypothetical protein